MPLPSKSSLQSPADRNLPNENHISERSDGFAPGWRSDLIVQVRHACQTCARRSHPHDGLTYFARCSILIVGRVSFDSMSRRNHMVLGCWRRGLACSLFALLMAGPVSAQVTGSIAGTVCD